MFLNPMNGATEGAWEGTTLGLENFLKKLVLRHWVTETREFGIEQVEKGELILVTSVSLSLYGGNLTRSAT